MTAADFLAEKRPEIESLCRKYGVTRLRLFGSGVRDGWNPEKSDIDFLAEFGEPPPGINLFTQFFRFMVELEETVGHRIDLVDWKAVTKPSFRQEAEAEAQDWYAA